MHNPRHIVITGASSGLGAALALFYAKAGVMLSLTGRDATRLEEVAAATRAKGAATHITTLDIIDADAVATWLESCDARQPVELIIANAGISAGTGGGGETQQQVARIFATNINGVVNTVYPLLPRLAARGGGQVAIIASLAGFRGLPSSPAYSASKAAVRVLGEGLRGEWSTQGVAINVVCPGYVITPMTAVNRFPMPWLMTAQEAANRIAKGLAANQPRIAFPWPMYLLVRVLAALPVRLTDLMLRQLPKKPAME